VRVRVSTALALRKQLLPHTVQFVPHCTLLAITGEPKYGAGLRWHRSMGLPGSSSFDLDRPCLFV